jgi:hypothetical protein
MGYRAQERRKVIDMRESLFKDSGNGIFSGREWEFVLNDPVLNLWEGIRADAQQYFKRNKIPWWRGNKDNPTGHLLSSQIACVNHLYYLRQRKDLATAVLNQIDSEITEALVVDDGYVEFEFIGDKQYLKEKSWQRGANCTSIDAAMIGLNSKGTRKIFLIEWKYTEDYPSGNKYIDARSKVYDELIKDSGSPFKEVPVEAFYYEPFYQLMRQILLAWKLIENNDHECRYYHHIHVIPKENKELLQNITSPYLKGDNHNISEAWKSTLKNPDKYLSVTPQYLLNPCLKLIDCQSFLSYLEKRYW